MVAEWHLMAINNKSRLAIKQSLIALPLYAIKGVARMPLIAIKLVGKNKSPA